MRSVLSLCVFLCFAGCSGVTSFVTTPSQTSPSEPSSDEEVLGAWQPPSGGAVSSIGLSKGECVPAQVAESPIVIAEAETFSTGTYWSACPGPSCGNDVSANASGKGHIITKENTTAPDPQSRIVRTVSLPSAGTWYLWAKSARTGANRQWGATVNGVPLSATFGSGAVWVNAGSISVPGTQIELGIFDASPDSYWSYPDAFILSSSVSFNPTLCPNGAKDASDCEPGNHAPVVFLRSTDVVNGGDTYTLDLDASDPDCDELSYQWKQTSGPTVFGLDSNESHPSIQLPSVTSDVELALEVSVSDGKTPPVSKGIVLKVLAKIELPTAPRTCAQISHAFPCVEISECGKLSARNTYYLLKRDLSSTRTCLLATDDIVIDLNTYTIRYDVGYGDTASRLIPNAGFEESAEGASGDTVLGWDLSKAPGAKVVSTWSMPLVGSRVLYVPANGEVVSGWMEIPVANRSYRGSLVQRGNGGTSMTITVERDLGGGATEVVCSRSVSDGLGGGKAAYCNFHGKPAGSYRIRATSTASQHYDDAAIVPSLAAGIGAVSYFTQWQERDNFVCNLDDGTCNLPDDYELNNPTVRGGNIEIRNGTIKGASRSMRSYGVFVKGAKAVLRNVTVEANGTAAQTVAASSAWIFFSTLKANMPWVINREDLTETNATFGSGTVISDSQVIGGQGTISFNGALEGTVRRSRLINRATVTNHYAICLGGSEHIRIEGNQFNCAEGDANCPAFSGSGITLYRSRNCEISDNTFYMVSAPCDAEYVNGVFSTNAIRMTDYDAPVGATNGVTGNLVHHNVFHLKGVGYPLMPKCAPYANGVFYSVGAGDNFIESNQFNIDNTSSLSASYAFYIGASHNGGIWKSNVVNANDNPVWYSSAYGAAANARMIGNTFNRIPNPSISLPDSIPAIRMGYCCGNEASNLLLKDNNLGAGFEWFQFTSNQPAPYSVEFLWSVNLEVRSASGAPISGATVKLNGASTQFAGTTDDAGRVTLVARDYSQSGTNNWAKTTADKVQQNPYQMTIQIMGEDVHTESMVIHGQISKSVTVR